MPLAMVQAGRRVRLVAVNAGRGLQARLAAMGFVPGGEFEILRNELGGPLVVVVKDSRIVLGRGMAHKVLVQ